MRVWVGRLLVPAMLVSATGCRTGPHNLGYDPAAEHSRTKLLAQAVEQHLNPKQYDQPEGSKYD